MKSKGRWPCTYRLTIDHSFKNARTFLTRLVLAIGLLSCLGWIALQIFHQGVPAAHRSSAASTNEMTTVPEIAGGQLRGREAREYLEQAGEGQSLMQAVTAARFGLQWQPSATSREQGGGYVGMSHDQNLNAWFAEDGITVRPTVSEQAHERSWHMDMRLKAYGYGDHLVAAPPIVSRQVKGNRIEYERADCQLPIVNCQFERATIAGILSSNRQLRSGTRTARKASSRASPLPNGPNAKTWLGRTNHCVW